MNQRINHKKMRKYLKMNENETYWNVLDTVKAVLRGNFIVISFTLES